MNVSVFKFFFSNLPLVSKQRQNKQSKHIADKHEFMQIVFTYFFYIL